jgi:hypothetical protein
MADNNSAEEPTNFPVGNRDEVPSESPEKVETPTNPAPATVPNDTPQEDVDQAKAGRDSGSAAVDTTGDDSSNDLKPPSADPNPGSAQAAAN